MTAPGYAPNTAAKLRKVAARLAVTVAERDALVCELRDQGATLRAIADAAMLTPPGVARILKRNDR